MGKKSVLLILALLLPLAAAAGDYRLFYTDYSIAYATVISPSQLQNNSTGTTDTVSFSASMGINAYEWINVYGGASFMFFPYASNMQKHISMIPVYGGIKVNIFPEFMFYASVFAEAGAALCNKHDIVMMADKDTPWTGSYFNWGADINYRLNDIAILALRIDMPSVSGTDGIDAMSLFRLGLGWKVNY